MDGIYSRRFGLEVLITRHASERMRERNINESMLVELIETGERKEKDKQRMWLFKSFPDRDDNLICAAVVLEKILIVKTVMIRWELVQ